MTAPPRSPFDELRSRGLVVQFLVLLGVALWSYDWLAGPGARGRISGGVERLGMVVTYCLLALLLFVRGRLARLDWGVLFGRRPTRSELALAAVIIPVGVLTLGATVAVFVPLSYVAPRLVTRLLLTSTTALDVRSLVEWLELTVVACVAAPVVEELFFRGILLHRWTRRWGSARAVVASSVLFAVLHGEWVGHFLFGVAMCALYLRTRTLWLPIIAHALSNFVVQLFTLQDALGAPSPPDTLESLRAEWPTGVIALVAGTVLLLWYLHRWWPEGRLRAVLTGPVPYDVYAASGTVSPDSTSAS